MKERIDGGQLKVKAIFITISLLAVFYLAAPKSSGGENLFSVESLFSKNPGDSQAKIDTLEKKLARLQSVQNGVIIQPIRQGFPYCEPFKGSILERVNTKVGGSAELTAAPGQNNGVLELTNTSTPEQLGYAFIDLPFSSTYGIKVSFEYFIYNSTGDPGDGISFFLYDGAIPASEFKIGGLGGSLGYAPHGNSPGGFTGDPVTGQGFGGLNGGYLGIGFDVFGNFGNEYQRKYGGFLRPNDYWASHLGVTQPRYPNSVVVRGPQIIQPGENRRNGMPASYTDTGLFSPPFTSYAFIDGKVTFDNNSVNTSIVKGTGSLPKTSQYFVSPQFRLGTSGRVDNCNQDGYRKVFIDFKPVNPTNPSAGYLIDVDMLVNIGGTLQLVNVLSTTFDPTQQVPPTFKLGFAGATGSRNAYQEIRNVTVQVSNENQLTKPATNDLKASACVGEEEFFELDVNLQNINSQIQCIQLYKSEAEALAVQNQLNQISNVKDCNSGICQIEVCKSERVTATTSLGEFEAFIFLEKVNGQDKEVPRIKFKSVAGVTGTTTIWYTVTDNFGQISAPKKIIVTINPTPKIDGTASIINPTCNGQSDGTISNVIIKDLIPGYIVTWKDSKGNKVPEANYTKSETTQGDYIKATLGLKNVNVDTYTLTVNNPATKEACDDNWTFRITDVRGTPVDVVLDDQKICQGTPVVFTPQLEDATDAANPRFTWWKDNQKTKPITNGLTEGNVKYEISGAGTLTVTGLAQNTTPYEYFVEVTADPTQSICASPAGTLKKVKVLVVPPLTLSSTVTDDFCRAGIGKIEVAASGGLAAFTYSLNGGPAQASNTFSGLFPGIYTVTVSAGTNCIGTLTAEVKGAPELILKEDRAIQPACGLANGQLEVSFTGGSPGYKLEFFKNGTLVESPATPTSPKVYKDLLPGKYEVKLTDTKGCVKTLSWDLVNSTGIPVTIDGLYDELCEGDQALILPKVTTTGPVQLKWYKDLGATQEIVSSATADANGHIFTINPTTLELKVSGLKKGEYAYYLLANGPGYCPAPPFKATVKVFEPIAATLKITEEICAGAADGTITVTATGADGNFEYSLDNSVFVNSPVFTNLKPDNYTVYVRSKGPNGCTFQTTAEVKKPDGPISTNVPTIIRSSCNLNNGRIEDLVISGGWGGYTAEWRRGSLTGPLVSGTLTGAKDLFEDTYFLIVKDQKGCIKSFEFRVNDMPDPVFVFAPEEVCAGQSVTLKPVNTVSGSSPTDLIWYKDAGKTQAISNGADPADATVSYAIDPSNGNLTINGLKPNSNPYTYYLHVVCTNVVVAAQALVRVVPNPVFASELVSCFGGNDGKILVTSGGDAKFRYSVDGGAPITENQLESLTFSAKTYSIAVTNEGFCLANFSLEVKQPLAALKVDPLQKVDPSCATDIGIIKTQLTGGWAPYAVTLIRNGATDRTATFAGPQVEFTNLSPATYSLLIKDSEGCEIASAPITLVYGPTSIAVNDVEICEGEDAVFKPIASPVPTGAVFQWYKNSALTVPVVSSPTPDANGHTYTIASDGTLTVSGLKAGNSPASYYVVIRGGNSCPGFVASPKAIINRMPTLRADIKDEVCFGEKGSITLLGGLGDGVFTYSLDGVTFQTGNRFEVVPGTYTGYVKTGAGCMLTLPNLLVKGPASSLKVSTPEKKDASCNASDGWISFAVSGGYSSSYTVVTKRNNVVYRTAVMSEGTFILVSVPSGNYSFTVTDAGGCVVDLPQSIQIEDLPTPLAANNEVICAGEVATLIPTTTQQGITPVYSWYMNSNGTQQIQSGTLNGVTYQLGADGRLSISGLPGKETPYRFYVKISGVNVCEPPLLPVEVLVYEIPNLRVSDPSIVCDPEGTVDLTQFIEGFNPAKYDYIVISPSGATMRLEEIDAVNQSGNYQVQSSIKGANCWSRNLRIKVLITDEEMIPDFGYEADFGGGNFVADSEAQILENVNFQDRSLGKVILWNWDFGDGTTSTKENPTHIYKKKGIYTVKLTTTDVIGCVAVKEQLITVLDENVVMIPNAFTPEGPKNQFFKPQFRGIGSMQFFVFSTWGELIFQADQLDTRGWDGTLNGAPAPNGNYVYKGIFVTRSGEKIEKSGVFLLIR